MQGVDEVSADQECNCVHLQFIESLECYGGLHSLKPNNEDFDDK